MAASELASKGWHLSEDGITKCCEEAKTQHSDIIIKRALDIDLKEIGAKCLPEDINKGRVDCVEGPIVLQVSKLRIVSAPKDNEESQTAPRLCRVWLTDGHTSCSAVTLEVIKGIGPPTLPGSKVLLSGPVEVESNFLLLNGKNVKFLGGDVESLTSVWKLKKSLVEQSLARNEVKGEGGPPPFVAFGTKINKNEPIPAKKDFKSLDSGKDKEDGGTEDDEFQQQRQATIQQALKAKSSGQGAKTSFGGGQKQLVKDTDVARIVEMGFSAPDASTALRSCGGNVNEAINSLVSGGPHRGGMGGRFGDRGRPGSRGGHREGRGGRRRQVQDREMEDDDEDYLVNTRRSGPTTLSDFLDEKLFSSKEDSKKGSKAPTTVSKPSVPLSSPASSTTTASVSSNSGYNASSNSKYAPAGAQQPVFKHSNQRQNRPNTSQGFSQSSSDSPSTNHNRPSSNYNNREASGAAGYQGNRGNDFSRPPHKGYSDSSGGGEDRRQHTVLPPRFARQRTEAFKVEGGARTEGVEQDSRQKSHQEPHQGPPQGRQPLLENNHNNYNQQGGGGRYGKNSFQGHVAVEEYRGGGGHPGQGAQRGGAQFNSRYDENQLQKQSFNAGYGKDFDSANQTRNYGKKEPLTSTTSALKPNSASNSSVSSSQPAGYPKHQQTYPRNSGRPGGNEDYHHDQGWSGNQLNNGANPYQKFRQHQPYSQPNQHQHNQHQHNQHQPNQHQPNQHQPNQHQPNQHQPNQHQHNQLDTQEQMPRHHQDRDHQSQSQPKLRNDRRLPGPPGPGSVEGVRYVKGDLCMAKYWEDNKFYKALVQDIGPAGTTLVVLFLEYGNVEELYASDVKPIQAGHMGNDLTYPPHPMSADYGMPGGHDFEPMGFADGSQFVHPMQFTRGQGHFNGGGGVRKKQTQNFYAPPGMRH